MNNLIGKKFGRLTVIKQAEDYIDPNGWHQVQWVCKCECGNICIARACHLTGGYKKSCGCLAKERKNNYKHGLTNHPMRINYKAMKARCYNPHNEYYYLYGERGIYVCDEWLDDFKAFYDWGIANGWKKGLTIDRIDVNGPYSPDNCRWATPKEQARNTRTNIMLTANGKTLCLTDWCNITGLCRKTITDRLNKGWTVEEALFTKRWRNK